MFLLCKKADTKVLKFLFGRFIKFVLLVNIRAWHHGLSKIGKGNFLLYKLIS